MKCRAKFTPVALRFMAVGLVVGGCVDPTQFLPDVTLEIETEGSGTVTPNGGTFRLGDQVTLTATPEEGSRFDHWEGDASGSQNPLVITMGDNKTITAVFEATEEGTVNSGPFKILLLAIQASVLDDGTLSVAIPLKTGDEDSAENVQITRLEIPGVQFLGPEPLPRNLGEMPPGTTRTVNALFSAPDSAQTEFVLTIAGTFESESLSSTFELAGEIAVERSGPGPVVSAGGVTAKLNPAAVTYPPAPPAPPVDFELNEGNQQGILPPLGPYRNFFAAAPAESTLNFMTGTAAKSVPRMQGARALVVLRNTVGTTGTGFPPDPSVAGPDPSGFAMYAVNTLVAYSKNFGATFTDVALTAAAGFNDPADPGRRDFFPQDDGGLCCDQVVIYIPAPRNIFVWLLQYNVASIALPNPAGGLTLTTGHNRLRIAYATPQAAAADFLHAWTWFDITSAGVGIGEDWMDYPDLAYSDTFLYVGVDHAIQGTGQARSNRHIFVRASLNDMLNPNASSVGFRFTNPTRGLVYQNHIVQNSRDTMYWAALPNTSTLVVYDWPDNSDNVNSHDIPVSTWCNTDYSANAPDGANWNVAPALALGATRTDPAPGLCPPGQDCGPPPRYLYFAWSAGRANPCTIGSPPKTVTGRPFPYVRVAKVNANNFTLVNEVDIWNSNFAFATPALVTRPEPVGSSIEDVAVSLAVGGGGSYANNAVGFLNDFNYIVTTSSDATQFNGTIARYGDYFNVRNSFTPVTVNGQGFGYSTLAYTVRAATAGQTCAVGGCNAIPQFVLFGREGDLIPEPPIVVH